MNSDQPEELIYVITKVDAEMDQTWKTAYIRKDLYDAQVNKCALLAASLEKMEKERDE